MILSWGSKAAENIWKGNYVKKLPNDIQRTAKRKLVHVHAACRIADLLVPPGNHLEKLTGDKQGYWSIRINDQWRVCFRWKNGNAFDVDIIDYH